MDSNVSSNIICSRCKLLNPIDLEDAGGATFCRRCGHALSDGDTSATNPLDGNAGAFSGDLTLDGPSRVPGRTARPPGILWLVYLFFRPRIFFQNFVVDSIPSLTAVCAWFFGMAGVINRIDRSLIVNRSTFSVVGAGWATYWSYVAFCGVLAGLLYFGIGGWWYRVRLCWSGAKEPDRALARRVYLFAAQIYALPILVVMLAETSAYSTPLAAANAESGWYLLLLITPFWSAWNSYVGVRTAFDVRRFASMIWFLFLPSLLYFLAIGAVLVATIVPLLGSADIENPNSHDSTTLHFSYPGNWRIDTDRENYDPNSNVYIEPIQDASLHIMAYESQSGPEEEMETTLVAYQEVMSKWREEATFDTWGLYSGLGRSIRAEIDGEPCQLRVFVSPVGENAVLEVRELCSMTDVENVAPGFELIRFTFRLKQ